MFFLIVLTLLEVLLSPSFRITATPQTAFAPASPEIRVYLNGTERELSVALYDTDGFLLRSSSQELLGEKLIYVKWRRVGPCDCTLRVTVMDHEQGQTTKTLDLHYLE